MNSFLLQAIRLAAAGLGQVTPNPSVGAVVVKDDQVIGYGRTADGGRPHAEVVALEMAGKQAAGACLYVTLEPCAHQGKSPACTQAIIQAGIQKVVVGCRDPFPKVDGKGMEQLRQAGIQVEEAPEPLQQACRAAHAGFFSTVQRHRPYVTMKIASSQDDFIAPASNVQQWITGPIARNHGHWLRSRNDAILTGIGTILADDPQLTCRLPGLEHRSPIRIILDRQNRLPEKARLLQDNGPEVWHITENTPLPALLEQCAERGITRLMVEAGQTLNTAFLQAGLVDEIYWYRAPEALGEGYAALNCPFTSTPIYQRNIGKDTLSIYAPPIESTSETITTVV